MEILKLWVATSHTVADTNMQPSSSGQKMEMENSTKMFITIYQIMWCYIVNSYETVIQKQILVGGNTSNFTQREAGITYSARNRKGKTSCFVFPCVRIQESFFSVAPSGSLDLAKKSGWMTAKLFLSLLKHIWQQSCCSRHYPFCCYFKTTWVTSPLLQLRLLKVTAFQSSLFHCTVAPTTATRSYSFWTSDKSAVNFNFQLSTLIAFQKNP